MEYFKKLKKEEDGGDVFLASQHDIADIIFALNDRRIPEGKKFYEIFSCDDLIDISEYLAVDFLKIKTKLGIVGEYLERIEYKKGSKVRPRRNFSAVIMGELKTREVAPVVFESFKKEFDEVLKKYKAKFNKQ